MFENITKEYVLDNLDRAFENEEFFIMLQPQYSHSTGLLIGAEALVRWKEKENGIIPPIKFIPVLEKTKNITKLDLYVFDKLCAFIKTCNDNHFSNIPISFNVSRVDIDSNDFIDNLETIRKKYDINPALLPVEITESAAVDDLNKVVEFINKLHSLGYKVEMDDFGSGYSSLNVLKEVNFDLIKLDMAFLKGNFDEGKAGIILSSIVRMINYLGLPMIAEGVETINQADFMRSVGCDYIQGYLYSKPINSNEFFEMLRVGNFTKIVPQLKLIDSINQGTFWDPDSQETLIFNSYTSGSSIIVYDGKKIETLRVNQKYLKELGMNLDENDAIKTNILELMDDENKKIFIDMLNKAISSTDEFESECWWTINSRCCGSEKLCLRLNTRLIGKKENEYLFYLSIRNITAEKRRYNDILDSERRFKMASEQVNIYYWEYTVATKEMRPCFRCMRDLGLPALVTNYPEPAIEMGIFPPEVADMYRDWHKQIANGVKHLEAIIPLTVGRVPFLVRYTTEFDSAGKPVKAYGSAALVIDNK